MAHPRKAIRAAVKAALIAAVTGAGSRVYATRMLTLRDQELPAIGVYTLDEESDDQESAPRELTREVSLILDCWLSATDGVDDDLDDFAWDVETAMHADPYFAGACGDSTLTATDSDVGVDGDREIGIISLKYLVTYRTDAPEAPTLTDDFDTGHSEFVVSDDANDAEDTFTVGTP